MNNDRAVFLDAYNAASSSPRGRTLRESAARAVVAALVENGKILWVSAWMLKDKRAEGVAIVAQMAGQLGKAITAAYEDENWYAGAAMVRQLIEAEYLIWLFAQRVDDAADWLIASPEMLRKTWSPASMRKRSAGRFKDAEYRTHCELGGHPVPKARYLLPEHSSDVDHHILWVDLVEHLRSLWRDLTVCVKALGYADLEKNEHARAAEAAMALASEVDPAMNLPSPPIE